MKRASILASLSRLTLALAIAGGGLLALSACRKSSPPLPPGNWTGRCPAAEPNASPEFGPAPTTFVRDKAGIFTKAFISDAEAYLSAFQQETCHQLTVVTVASLEGQSLDSYAANYANRVGLGYRRLNNGVMLVIAPKINQARIQIGCGLEDVITDADARGIMTNKLLPAMEESSWQQAVSDSVNALMALARKKPIAQEYRPEGCRAAAAGAK